MLRYLKVTVNNKVACFSVRKQMEGSFELLLASMRIYLLSCRSVSKQKGDVRFVFRFCCVVIDSDFTVRSNFNAMHCKTLCVPN